MTNLINFASNHMADIELAVAIAGGAIVGVALFLSLTEKK
jgi:hypothetical protein